MKYEINIPKNASQAIVNRKRVVVYAPKYTDGQLQNLGEIVQAALGAAFVGFTADNEPNPSATEIVIEWTEADAAAEVALIDQAFVDWYALLSEGGE